jgi:hypothetical protein
LNRDPLCLRILVCADASLEEMMMDLPNWDIFRDADLHNGASDAEMKADLLF